MAVHVPTTERHPKITGLLNSNSYIIVVLILTIFSLALMVVQFLLPEGTETWQLVNLYNNLTCIFFLIDFAMRMIAQPVKRDYFIGQQGYFDLLGSIPSFGFCPVLGAPPPVPAQPPVPPAPVPEPRKPPAPEKRDPQ